MMLAKCLFCVAKEPFCVAEEPLCVSKEPLLLYPENRFAFVIKALLPYARVASEHYGHVKAHAVACVIVGQTKHDGFVFAFCALPTVALAEDFWV